MAEKRLARDMLNVSYQAKQMAQKLLNPREERQPSDDEFDSNSLSSPDAVLEKAQALVRNSKKRCLKATSMMSTARPKSARQKKKSHSSTDLSQTATSRRMYTHDNTISVSNCTCNMDSLTYACMHNPRTIETIYYDIVDI